MLRIDAHCHFWDPARGDYGWLLNGPAALEPLRRVHAPEELAERNGGRAVIAVQAADTVEETRYLLSLARQHPQIRGVVGWVDLSRSDSVATLEELAQDPRLKGIRPMLQDLAEDDWIVTRPEPEVIRALIRLGLRFDALVLTRHLEPLARFVARWPELPVIIDHCAKPVMGGGLDPDWRAGMVRLARESGAYCKLSGLFTELPERLRPPGAALEAMRPVLDQVLEAFGAERLVWGSDWPVLTLAAPHALWEEVTERLLAPLLPGERAAILGGNASRFYGIGGEDG